MYSGEIAQIALTCKSLLVFLVALLSASLYDANYMYFLVSLVACKESKVKPTTEINLSKTKKVKYT